MTPEMDALRSELILDYRLEMWQAELRSFLTGFSWIISAGALGDGIKIPDERLEILYA